MNRIIILNPIVSEKTMLLARDNKYTFKVDVKSNKKEVAKAIESLYKVKVAEVNILKEKGETRRFGKKIGRTADIKKAYITLEKGHKIKEFEIEEDKPKEKQANKSDKSPSTKEKSEK